MLVNTYAKMSRMVNVPKTLLLVSCIAAKVNCLPRVRLQDLALLVGFGGMLPRKIFKIWVSKMAFPAF